jgi:pyridoxine/pyridoxamine 5'-phosphate oxidase
VRSTILRDCDPDAGTVAFATDARSAKVAEIGAQPWVALTFWDDGTGVQVRLQGRATVADVDERRRGWSGRTTAGCSSAAAPAGAAGASCRD